MRLLIVAGDDAARKATELRQQAQGGAADAQAAQEEPRSYLKQLLTPYRVRRRTASMAGLLADPWLCLHGLVRLCSTITATRLC